MYPSKRILSSKPKHIPTSDFAVVLAAHETNGRALAAADASVRLYVPPVELTVRRAISEKDLPTSRPKEHVCGQHQ